ncbi:MAG: head decoration protein [Ghiorsea sp.]|nr:head decoration protein [Ghiorsea sp.]MDQ7005158.1 head decoration protein [Ghiorsea sp.]
MNDTLVAGADLITDSATVALGQVLTRGQILGRITATGELTALNAAATDGSQNVHSILSQNVDATAAAVHQ